MKIDVESRDFFKDPFTEIELKKIIKMTGKKPEELLRKRDKTYKEMKLDQNKKTDSRNYQTHGKISRVNFTSNSEVILKNKAIVGKIDPKEIKK